MHRRVAQRVARHRGPRGDGRVAAHSRQVLVDEELDDEDPDEQADDRQDLVAEHGADPDAECRPERGHRDRAEQEPPDVAGVDQQVEAAGADHRDAAAERETDAERAEAGADEEACEHLGRRPPGCVRA